MSVRNLVHITTVPMSLTFLRGQVGYMAARGLGVRALCMTLAEESAMRANLPGAVAS